MELKFDKRTDSPRRNPKRFWVLLLLVGIFMSLGCEGSEWIGRMIIGAGRAYFGWFQEGAQESISTFYSAAPGDADDYHNVIWGYNFIELTGVFTPTNSTEQGSTWSIDLETVPEVVPLEVSQSILDEFGEKGYLAFRVPHAPPTYTASSIFSPTLSLTYYAPPTSTTSTVTMTKLTRRTEYEATVNATYPITDGKSHWEVWWLPDGQVFPVPDEPFRTESTSLRFDYLIDLGDGVPSANCAGCPISYLIWNGYTFIGPFQEFIVLMVGPSGGDPAVTFDMCGPPSNPSMLWFIRPTEPITHEHCLENDDSLAHTFDLDFSSSQNWNYQYYTQTNQVGSDPVPLVGNQVDLAAYGAVRILAVVTPPVSEDDTMRETYTVQATVQDDPTMWATASSLALAPSYQLDESGSLPYTIYLPVVLRE